MTDDRADDRNWERLNLLGDSVRRRLYEFVTRRKAPVGREEAAQAVGLSRNLAAYHLDKLADAGLLDTSFARTTGKSGPGAGRPAKHYQRAEDEVTVSVPPRSYDLLASLFADAVTTDPSGEVRTALMDAAAEQGRARATESGDLIATLRRHGYQPALEESGDVILRNCPFHRIAQQHTELVCGLNESLLRGCLSGCGDDPDRAELAPAPGRCCVVIHPARVA